MECLLKQLAIKRLSPEIDCRQPVRALGNLGAEAQVSQAETKSDLTAAGNEGWRVCRMVCLS